MICLDNSEWTRNGDYLPTRFEAQTDAANVISGAKTNVHPEATVGVMLMSPNPSILVTPTTDLGKVLSSISNVTISGECNFSSSLQIAQLSLKHRENKRLAQRIVMFVGSPVTEEKEVLVKIAKNLKKNNVAVDIISFGHEAENAEKLEAFYNAVNNVNVTSNLVNVPEGPILSSALANSAIIPREGSSYTAMGGLGGASDGFEFGVDPNQDPELALALRVSMEEERERQRREGEAAAAAAIARLGVPTTSAATSTATSSAAEVAKPAPSDANLASTPLPDVTTPSPSIAAVATPAVNLGSHPLTTAEDLEMDEDYLLQQALAMSMEVDTEVEAPTADAPVTTASGSTVEKEPAEEKATKAPEPSNKAKESSLDITLPSNTAKPSVPSEAQTHTDAKVLDIDMKHGEDEGLDEDLEDEQLQMAIRMSMEDSSQEKKEE